MIFVSFLVGMIVGSVLSSVALLLAIGITSQRDDVPVVSPEQASAALDAISPHAPTEIPHQATIGPYPSCPTCGQEADVLIKSWNSSRPIGFECWAHGPIR